jgi:hypothetical protein
LFDLGFDSFLKPERLTEDIADNMLEKSKDLLRFEKYTKYNEISLALMYAFNICSTYVKIGLIPILNNNHKLHSNKFY